MLASQYLTLVLIALVGSAATQDLPGLEPTLDPASPVDIAPKATAEPANGATLGVWNDANDGTEIDTSDADVDANANDNNAAAGGQVPTTLQTITTRPSILVSTESVLAPPPVNAVAEESVRDVNGIDGIGRVGRVLPTPTPAQHGLLPVTYPYGGSSSSTASQ